MQPRVGLGLSDIGIGVQVLLAGKPRIGVAPFFPACGEEFSVFGCLFPGFTVLVGRLEIVVEYLASQQIGFDSAWTGFRCEHHLSIAYPQRVVLKTGEWYEKGYWLS